MKKKSATQLEQVTKTNQSPYVDGMDIDFAEENGKMIIDPLYYEDTPDLMESSLKDSITWILELNKEIVYLEQINPQKMNLHLERLKYIIGEYSFKTLEEYNSFESHVRNIKNLYQDLLQKTLLNKIIIESEETSLGKYELKILSENRAYTLSPKSSFTREEVINEITEKIIKPRIDIKVDDESSNYEKYRKIVNDTSSR